MSKVYYANGTAMVLSNKLFSAEKFSRLAECANIAEALRILQESQYGGGQVVDNASDFERLLESELYNTVDLLRQLSSDAYSLDYFTAKYDYLNAKALAKAKFAAIDGIPYCFACAKIPAKEMRDLINKGGYDSFSPFMEEALREIDALHFEDRLTPEFSDVILDKAMFRQMLADAKKSKYQPLYNCHVFLADATNLLVLFRSKKNRLPTADFAELVVDGGSISADRLWQLYFKEPDRIVSDFLFTKYHPLVKYIAECFDAGTLHNAEQYVAKVTREYITENTHLLSMQPLLAYFVSKINEIDKLRYIFICIKNGVSSENIKDRLKQYYA
jgi:V/A-type H+-transporting ATPase subunit C